MSWCHKGGSISAFSRVSGASGSVVGRWGTSLMHTAGSAPYGAPATSILEFQEYWQIITDLF